MIRSVTVFCSSSSAVPRVYTDTAAELGRALAAQRWTLIYGGNNVGTMGALADGCRQAGGQVVGVTPQLFIDKGVHDAACHELVVTECMRTRKAAMEERGDAFVTLPGGLGTLEEIFEILVGKQLGYHRKPIVLLNVDNFFDPLLTMIEHGIEQRFIKSAARALYFVAATVDEAIEHIRTYEPPVLAEKWFEKTVAIGLKDEG
ncbi:MAG: TIGR00730 family Rossman fold protein [Planctomycetota bacterium]|nr:TIGR00730 family Rossman fold protein [Planctomycetota bacterium]